MIKGYDRPGATLTGAAKDLTQLKSWVAEAESAHSEWRRESWTDSRIKDGHHWTDAERNALLDKGINPLTINRVFPIINLIAGNFAMNQHDIVAVGRTSEDAEISQVMSEAVAFVMDQYGGYDLVFDAFQDQLVPGFGVLGVGINNDPRKEKVKVRKYPWYSVWWDPYSDPWLDPVSCRYSYYADWKDLDAVKVAIPRMASDLEEHFAELTSLQSQLGWSGNLDQGSQVEDKRNNLSDGARWADKKRRRVRPVEIWYTVPCKVWFAAMPDGSYRELDRAGGPREQFALVQAADQCVCATVNKIRVATFVGDLLLDDRMSPLPHDRYPFIPFVGYLDSYQFPYGVPRQIREMNMEVNKRRSMALALINNRRVIMERNSAEDPHQVYDEVNRTDGLILLNDGKSGTFQIQELQGLAQPQIDLLQRSETEIQEIAGANNESMGYKTSSMSEIALENKQQRSGAMTASLLKNLKKSQRMLGESITALVQDTWTGPKVLRVTDRMTGAERFTTLNDPHFDRQTGQIRIKNNITQGRYDIIISDRPMTDTVREKNLELIFSAIQKAPPEAIAPLLTLAFELSNLPNKEQLLHQLRMALGVEPIDPLLTSAEADARAAEKQREVEQQRADEAQLAAAERMSKVDKDKAQAEKFMAEAQEIIQRAGIEQQRMALEQGKLEIDAAKLDIDVAKLGLDQQKIASEEEAARAEQWTSGYEARQKIAVDKEKAKADQEKAKADAAKAKATAKAKPKAKEAVK